MSVKFKCESDRHFELHAETELRFEVANNSEAYITLKSGSAECFGSELICDKKYSFRPNVKASIFTWQGCKLFLSGSTTYASVFKDTAMVIYASFHASIEQLRRNAETARKKGPTVLVVGPENVGKSTMCRILINYAVRQGRKPVFVDLDVGQGQISIPGTLSALIYESQIDIEETFKQEDALVYHFGLKSPVYNITLYNILISQIANVMNAHLENNHDAFVSGTIINTCGWIKSHGYRSIKHTALAFDVDVVLAIGQERLFKKLRRDMPPFVEVVFMPRTIEVFERSVIERNGAQDLCVKAYFYGFKNLSQPHKFDVSFNDVRVYKINSAKSNHSNFPLGTKYFGNLCLVPVHIGFNLLYHILSVSFDTDPDDNIIEANVAGFICVLNVDTTKRTLTILSPHPAPLPQSILLLSEISFTYHFS